MAIKVPEEITHRKARHIDICLNHEDQITTNRSGFDQIDYIHAAAPELNREVIDLSSNFLKNKINLPLFISCMTGGSEESFRVNKNLAEAAGRAGIPVGLGSIRVLHLHPELFDQFHIKPAAGNVPVIANLGGVQLRDLPIDWIREILKRLEADALAVHLNPGQELFQDSGDRDFTGILDAFARLAELSPVPLIVKETGFGINPALAAEFTRRGAAAIDVAGSGGTNWLLVESVQGPEEIKTAGAQFSDWGIPTAEAVAALYDLSIPVLASGGLRSAMDVAKSISLGAAAAGMALPFIKAEHSGGVDGILQLIDSIRNSLLDIMTMSGQPDISSLRRAPLMLSLEFKDRVRQLRQRGDWREYL